MTVALPPAILFDLDDTILMDDVLVPECWRVACESHASGHSACSAAALQRAIEEYAEWYWSDPERHRSGRLDLLATRRAVVSGALRGMPGVDASIARAIADTYSSERRERVRPFPGAIETLDALHARGVRMALITNGSLALQSEKIERFALRRYFDSIVVEGAFGCGKPDERVFRHALDELHAKAGETWMVGDRLGWDVEPAQRLGLTGIWVDVRGNGLPAGVRVQPDRIIRAISEIMR